MTWALAFTPPGRKFFAQVSEHISAQSAFDAMISHVSAAPNDLGRYTIRGEGFDLRKWWAEDESRVAELVVYGLAPSSPWLAVRYGSKSSHGSSKPVAYMTQARTLDALVRTIATDPDALRGRGMVVASRTGLACHMRMALRSMRVY